MNAPPVEIPTPPLAKQSRPRTLRLGLGTGPGPGLRLANDL